ncbi:MAG: type I polyketide synthase, partial [Pseudomonadota bacterium]
MTARPPEPGTTPSAAARAVAVIGIGVRFPGGVDGLERFWELLANGEDAIGEIPPDRMDTARLYDPEPASPGRIMTRYGGYLTDIDRFDAGFFGISPREAERMDPQQRLVLETAWEALEDAGVDAARLAGRPVGVFVGQWLSDFEARLLAAGERIDFEMTNGSGRYATAGRLSFFLGLEGPSLTLDTACSSALTALHMAVQSLRAGETEMAFAAGVNVILSPHVTIGYSQSRMMAPDGRCKFGDASGDGYVRSEGAGTLLLKPLARALADGDPIHAVIRGSAINNDGASSGLMGRPSRSGQARLIERALHDSGLHGATIGYVEAHGTGTPKGDPVELDAIGQVLATGRESPLPVGSVKTNIGHTEAAAGIAGLVKAILAVKHGKVPPSLHHHTPNPEIDWAGLRLSVPTALAEWPRDRAGAPRRAGVSAFGIAGSNAHVIVEEAPQPPAAPATARPMPARPALLPLSADGAEALGALAGRYAARLESDPRLAAADLAGAVATRRTALRSRAAFVAGDRAALAGALRAYAAGGAASAEGHATLGVGSTRPRIVFVAPGQGGQWVGMARGLVAREPAFRAAIEACEAALSGMVDWSLAAQLAAEPGDGVWRLDRIEVIQPVLASLAIAYAALWRAFGIAPDAVIGHSMGETAAAAIAGALPLEDALRVVVRRSALMARVSGQGGMALVELAPDALAARLAGHEATLSIAAQNGPRSAVIAGETAALDAVLAALEAEGIFCRKVKVDVASHSPQMEPLVAELVGGLGDLRPRPADCPILSTVLGAEIAGEALGVAYWGRNLREPVRFHDAVRAATAEGPALFVELGPHPVLKPALEDMGMVAACCGKRDAEDQEAFLTALGALWAAGLAVDWPRILPVPAGPVALPGYPWQRSRHWSAAAERDAGRGQADGAAAEADEATRTWLHHLAWVDAPCGTPGDAAEGGDWLVLDPDTARGVATAAALRDAGLTARAGTLEDLAGLAAPPRGILARAPEGDDAPFLPVRLLQTCLARGWPALPQLCLATAGAQALEGDPATLVSPAQAGL